MTAEEGEKLIDLKSEIKHHKTAVVEKPPRKKTTATAITTIGATRFISDCTTLGQAREVAQTGVARAY